MKILYKKILQDGRKIVVYSEGGNKVIILINDGKTIIQKATLWNWEEKLVKLLKIKKDELDL